MRIRMLMAAAFALGLFAALPEESEASCLGPNCATQAECNGGVCQTAIASLADCVGPNCFANSDVTSACSSVRCFDGGASSAGALHAECGGPRCRAGSDEAGLCPTSNCVALARTSFRRASPLRPATDDGAGVAP